MTMPLPSVRWGSGPRPAIFLHGFTGSAASFDGLRESLGPLFSVTAVDLPGHRDAPRLGLGDTLDSIAMECSGPTVLLGYSQGARLALAFALRHPKLVSHLVLESGTAGLRTPAERETRKAEDERRAQKLEKEGLEAFLAEWEAMPMFEGTRDFAEVSAHRRQHHPGGLAFALRALGQGVQPSFWDDLGEIHVPTLVVVGAKDEKFTAIGRALADGLPHAQLSQIEGSGHAPHLERPDEYAEAISWFFTNLGARIP